MALLPKRILMIYTGGTIGMTHCPEHPYLKPVDFLNIRQYLPEIDRLGCEIEYYSYKEPIDSSNMTPAIWRDVAGLIAQNYDSMDGFVIMHGTDTMNYTASALSFMLENLRKPVILTGSQLPVDLLRTDARDNLITALEIASHPNFTLPEVAVCFDSRVLRGNRTLKYSTEKFHAFISPNYPPLAEAGVFLEFFTDNWLQPHKNESDAPFRVQLDLDPAVGLLKFYPGIPESMVRLMLQMPELKAIVLETYGTGNLPDFPWFIDCLKTRIDAGLIVVNVTQCAAGKVIQERYKNAKSLLDIGVISGHDLTSAAAITKLMYLLGKYPNDIPLIKHKMEINLCGEMTEK